MSYDSTKPADNSNLVSSEIRENFRALKDDKIVMAKGVQFGLDASKPASPTQGDLYVATDNNILYQCIANGSWNNTKPASGSVKLTGGNYTTTNTSFENIDGTNCTITITTGNNKVKIGAVITSYFSVTGVGGYYDVTIDGVRQGGVSGLVGYHSSGNGYFANASFTYMTPSALSAGSHTFVLQHMSGSGNIMTTMAGNIPLCFWVEEVL